MKLKRIFRIPLAMLAAILLFAALREPAPMPPAAGSAADLPRYVLRGAQWRSFDDEGDLRFEGSARLIDYYDDESARLQDFEVRVPGRPEQPWVARAPQGYAPSGGGERLQLVGGVEGWGAWPDGQPLQFSTPELWVDAAARALQTEAEVEVRSAGRNGSARGMHVDGQTQRVSLLADVEIRYVPR